MMLSSLEDIHIPGSEALKIEAAVTGIMGNVGFSTVGP